MQHDTTLHIQSVPSVARRPSPPACHALPRRHAEVARATLGVATIGYLVPRTDFTGRVHSVFAQACNIAVGELLVTVCLARTGNGPTTLCLFDRDTRDLRDLFDADGRVCARDGVVHVGRASLRMTGAEVWRPAEAGPLLAPERIGGHLRAARRQLAQHRRARSSVIDSQAAPVVVALRTACHTLDSAEAARQADRLIGWGEGLTPAGDDFLVGLLAGLDALVQGNGRRQRFRAALASAVVSCMQRTTPIAAHYLRLAAGGHYNEPLVDLCNSLLAEPDWQAVDMRLQRALDVGATSGADTVSGLLAGLSAWLPAASTETSA
jgi:Protein of unknown function (DUF2877)